MDGAVAGDGTSQAWAGGSYESTATLGHAIAEADWQRTPEELPAPWKNVVTRCLKARPPSRFSSAEAVARALQPRRRFLKWTAATAAACILVVAGRQWRNEPPSTPVRVAVLPFSMPGDRIESAAGIGLEVADRLS